MTYDLAVNAVRTGKVRVTLHGWTVDVEAESFAEAASKVTCERGSIKKFAWIARWN